MCNYRLLIFIVALVCSNVTYSGELVEDFYTDIAAGDEIIIYGFKGRSPMCGEIGCPSDSKQTTIPVGSRLLVKDIMAMSHNGVTHIWFKVSYENMDGWVDELITNKSTILILDNSGAGKKGSKDNNTESVSIITLLAKPDKYTIQPPKQPKNVPNEAVWAGGADGGAWFLCKNVADITNRYNCTIYNDFTGNISAQGQFILRGYVWDAGKKRATYHVVDPITELTLRFYDGEKITLNEQKTLLPDGIIDYPFGDGHGKKQRYASGEPVGPEEEY